MKPAQPQQAPARKESAANHQPQRTTSSSDGSAAVKLRRKTSKATVIARCATNGGISSGRSTWGPEIAAVTGPNTKEKEGEWGGTPEKRRGGLGPATAARG